MVFLFAGIPCGSVSAEQKYSRSVCPKMCAFLNDFILVVILFNLVILVFLRHQMYLITSTNIKCSQIMLLSKYCISANYYLKAHSLRYKGNININKIKFLLQALQTLSLSLSLSPSLPFFFSNICLSLPSSPVPSPPPPHLPLPAQLQLH